MLGQDTVNYYFGSKENYIKSYRTSEIISKYFELPSNIILITVWNVGVYDMKKREWIEKFNDFETLISVNKNLNENHSVE